MNTKPRLFALLVWFATILAGKALAAVSATEAAVLGTSLTAFGAEKTGNRDGSIPAYSGGLPASTNPPGFKKDSGRWADPYAGEKPLYSITGQNMGRYEDKLSAMNKALLQRFPSFRMDVYASHRSVAFPNWVLDNTLKNATRAKLAKSGVALEGAYGGVPFPIPKNGHEAMWNHLLRYNGLGVYFRMRNWYVDGSGQAVNTAEERINLQIAYFDPKGDGAELKKNGNIYQQYAFDYVAPPQVVGNATIFQDTMDPIQQPRRAWTYSAASRRIRLAPDFAYDTPVAGQGGVGTYDEVNLFDGALDMFDFKLLGKREMLIPYNNYALALVQAKTLLTPKHLNPDHVRWELHRVWVVEATLKPGKRHTFSKRVFYFDEDWSGAGMSDEYDHEDRLVKGIFNGFQQLYDSQTPFARTYWGYDLSSGNYLLSIHLGDPGLGLWMKPEGFSKFTYTPDALPGRGAQR
ncbi:MAG: DUF1329 domain-containing protein [Sterolibacterium sp.]